MSTKWFNGIPRYRSHDPIGHSTVKNFRLGDYIKVAGSNKVYIRGEYDRSSKKYHLIDVNDVYGNGRYVRGNIAAHDDFLY